MMLPTGDPLGTVVTMLATPFGRLDGLAIDTAGAGGWRPTGSPPDSTSEGVIDGLPGSVSFPRRKVVVDGPPWGKIVGQRSPDTAIAVAVEDGINHGPHLGLAWPPTDAGRRQEGLQDSPLLACQITGVWLWVHTLSTFETPFWNRLSDLLICGILLWNRVRGFGFAGDRVHELQLGAGIGELGRVEMFQQVCDCAVGTRVRHWMDLYTQYSLLQIRQQVGLGAKQIAQQAAGVVRSGQLLAHNRSQRRLGAVGDQLHGVDQLLAAGSQPLELFGLG